MYQVLVGTYTTSQEAAEAYDLFALKHGSDDVVRLNRPHMRDHYMERIQGKCTHPASFDSVCTTTKQKRNITSPNSLEAVLGPQISNGATRASGRPAKRNADGLPSDCRVTANTNRPATESRSDSLGRSRLAKSSVVQAGKSNITLKRGRAPKQKDASTLPSGNCSIELRPKESCLGGRDEAVDDHFPAKECGCQNDGLERMGSVPPSVGPSDTPETVSRHSHVGMTPLFCSDKGMKQSKPCARARSLLSSSPGVDLSDSMSSESMLIESPSENGNLLLHQQPQEVADNYLQADAVKHSKPARVQHAESNQHQDSIPVLPHSIHTVNHMCEDTERVDQAADCASEAPLPANGDADFEQNKCEPISSLFGAASGGPDQTLQMNSKGPESTPAMGRASSYCSLQMHGDHEAVEEYQHFGQSAIECCGSSSLQSESDALGMPSVWDSASQENRTRQQAVYGVGLDRKCHQPRKVESADDACSVFPDDLSLGNLGQLQEDSFERCGADPDGKDLFGDLADMRRAPDGVQSCAEDACGDVMSAKRRRLTDQATSFLSSQGEEAFGS